MKISRPLPIFHFIVLSCSLLFGCAAGSAPMTEAMNSSEESSSPALKLMAQFHDDAAEANAEAEDSIASKNMSTSHLAKHVVSRKETANGISISNSNGNASGAATADEDQALLDTAMELTETAQEYWQDNDMDQAFESLDEAYSLILTIPNNSHNEKVTQQKEDLRYVISKRIVEMYASRHVSVKGSYNEIPMVLNDHVMREIKSFQTVERDFFMESYKRSGRFRPAMVKALKAAGIPEDISWLPLIESGFKTRALSRARAFGLWQFIPSTGYKFGLKRNAWIDERLDPEKATAGAIAYMKELHGMFGDWATVLAAYNCGEGAVGRVIRNQKISYMDNFWDFYERLPRETARYYPRFLAVLAIIKEPAKYGFTLSDTDQPLPYEIVNIERPVHLSALSEKIGVSRDDLTALNPELRQDATPNTSYALRVPLGKIEIVTATVDNLPKWAPPRVEYVVHRVRRGENLSLIAVRYRTSIDRIVELNNLRKNRLLRVGQRLKIPTRVGSSDT